MHSNRWRTEIKSVKDILQNLNDEGEETKFDYEIEGL